MFKRELLNGKRWSWNIKKYNNEFLFKYDCHLLNGEAQEREKNFIIMIIKIWSCISTSKIFEWEII